MLYWFQFVLFAIISGLIQSVIIFFIKKGENLATKQDIGEITDSMKSVESKYNSSLELFKRQLLDEHELSRSIFEICNNLDKELVEHLIKCKTDIEMEGVYEDSPELGSAFGSIDKLGDFLHNYKSRYSNLKDFGNLLQECRDMNDVSKKIDEGYFQIEETDYQYLSNNIKGYIENILKVIIPPIKVSQ